MAKARDKVYQAFQRIKERDYLGAESLLNLGLNEAQDPAEQAVYHSTLGVLFKVRGDFKEAWRRYEQAEKLLPDDPSLKIISAKFLIDDFAQYDLAIKKMKRVLDIAKGSPSFEHQARAILAIAFLRKGEKKKATRFLEEAMAGNFSGIVSAMNINLDVIEAFLARNFETDLCRTYLENGLELARTRQEEKMIDLFSRLLSSRLNSEEPAPQSP